MTNGNTRFNLVIKFDDEMFAEIDTRDYREGLKKARRLCDAKFG